MTTWGARPDREEPVCRSHKRTSVRASPDWTGPSQFVSGGEHWQDDYALVPTGCMTPRA